MNLVKYISENETDTFTGVTVVGYSWRNSRQNIQIYDRRNTVRLMDAFKPFLE